MMYEPGSEVRWTNRSEFWTVTRANRWGFLDRPPPSPERTAAGCHVTLLGDSFVEAREVPIADKVQVRLEDLARRRLPHLDVTTSAFGISGTGQVHQLPFYDHYARRLHPRLLVLVFWFGNDFSDNSPILTALENGLDPDRQPWTTAVRGADGGFELRPPDPEYGRFRTFTVVPTAPPFGALRQISRQSWFVAWAARKLGVETRLFFRPLNQMKRERKRWLEAVSQRPGWAWLGDARLERHLGKSWRAFAEEDLPPVFSEALAATGFALDEFKARAERDGAALVILAALLVNNKRRLLERLLVLAGARGIPVIDQHGYIVRQGGDPRTALWRHDPHWTPAGHQWAAEALFEWLERHQDVCRARTPRAGWRTAGRRTPTHGQGEAEAGRRIRASAREDGPGRSRPADGHLRGR